MNFTPNSRIVASIALLVRYFYSQVSKSKGHWWRFTYKQKLCFLWKKQNLTFLMRIVFFTPYRCKVNDIIIILGHFWLLERKSKGHLRTKTHERGKLGEMLRQIFAWNVRFWANCEFHTIWQYAANYSTPFQTLSNIGK